VSSAVGTRAQSLRLGCSARWGWKGRCLGFRKELEAAVPGAERDALFQRLVVQQYANGEAMNMAATLEIDAVIDPADTRDWLVRGLDSAVRRTPAGARFVDTW
jgi:acetyl-CoA carboxylase carboxyltransferase component